MRVQDHLGGKCRLPHQVGQRDLALSLPEVGPLSDERDKLRLLDQLSNLQKAANERLLE